MSFDESGQPIINPDAPLVDPEKAFPSRRRFASKLAAELRRLPIDQPTITAINGSWGSGKTTVWNLAKQELPKDEFDVLEFNPWRILDEANMVRQFFAELGVKIAAIDTNNAKERAKLWKSLSILCGLSKSVVDVVETVATTFIPIIPTICGKSVKLALTTIEKGSTTASEAATRQHEELNNLDAIRTRLSETLKISSTNKRILVIIDDLDRLTDEDIYLVIRMVKAVASLPRIHFLLLYDRPQIEAALGRKCADIGTSYLAKIVQHERILPFVGPDELKGTIEENITRLNSVRPLQADEQKQRYYDLYVNAMYKLLTTPRHWVRFYNAYAQNWDWNNPAEKVEWNAVDVMALELLRLAAPRLYDLLPHQKAFLLGNDRSVADVVLEDEAPLSTNRKINRLLIHCPKGNREIVEYLLTFLFPACRMERSGGEILYPTKNPRKNLQVCDDSCFDRYFCHEMEANTLSEAELTSILTGSKNYPETLDKLASFQDKQKFLDFLSRLASDSQLYSQINSPGPFLAAVLAAADKSKTRAGQIIPTIESACLLTEEILRHNHGDLPFLLQNILSNTDSRVAATRLLTRQDPRVCQANNNARNFDEAILNQAILQLALKWPLWHAAPEWILDVSHFYGDFIHSWITWGYSAQVQVLHQRLARTAEGLAYVLTNICNIGQHGPTLLYQLKAQIAEESFGLTELRVAMSRHRQDLIDQGHGGLVNAYDKMTSEDLNDNKSQVTLDLPNGSKT